MRFKEWLKLKENATTTASIAPYARIAIPMIRRWWPKDKKKLTNKESLL